MKMRWKIMLLIGALLAVIIILLWRLSDNADDPQPHMKASDTGPTIERIQALSSLTTLKLDVADAVASELEGRTGKLKAVLIVKGEVALGVDLSAAKFVSIDRDNRHAVIHLPQPKIQYVRLDHERTRVLGVWSSGLWTIVPDGGDADAAVVNRAYRDAERIVGNAANDPALVQRCSAQTENVLCEFLKALGWTIQVQWAL